MNNQTVVVDTDRTAYISELISNLINNRDVNCIVYRERHSYRTQRY